MAGNAAKRRVVARVGVAVRTGCPLACVCARINWEPGMVELCPGPRRGVMASLAGSGERGRHVVRACRPRVLRFVAGVAIRRRTCIAPAHMAVRTCDRGMRSRQWEHRLTVIENRRHPRCRVVAHLAIRGETAGHVVGVCCFLEIRQVTRHASGAEPDEYTVGMARAARQRNVRAGQRERRLGMLKAGAQPVRGAVTYGTICGKARRHMVRIRGLLERREMAGGTLRRRAGKFATDVALRACHRHMRSS